MRQDLTIIPGWQPTGNSPASAFQGLGLQANASLWGHVLCLALPLSLLTVTADLLHTPNMPDTTSGLTAAVPSAPKHLPPQ